MSSSLSSSKRERGLSVERLQCQRASPSIQGRISFVWWSCSGKLRDPLELRVDLGHPLVSLQASQISFGFVRDTTGFLAHHCRDE